MSYDTWTHHNTGWRYCVKGIKNTLSIDNGTSFYPNQIYQIINGSKIAHNKWTGVLHATSTCLKQLQPHIQNKYWQKNCLGLYVFSEHTAISVREYIKVPVCVLTHPTQFTNHLFDWDMFQNNPQKKLMFIGGWLRNTTVFEQLNCIYEKTLIKCPGVGMQYTGELHTIDYLPSTEYDKTLQKNIVFLDFIDTTTNNTLLECIVRHTPICVRRHPSIIEHLGENYPLYFNNVSEAEVKINCDKTIKHSYEYLKNMNKDKFTLRNFVNQIATSSIYKSIK